MTDHPLPSIEIDGKRLRLLADLDDLPITTSSDGDVRPATLSDLLALVAKMRSAADESDEGALAFAALSAAAGYNRALRTATEAAEARAEKAERERDEARTGLSIEAMRSELASRCRSRIANIRAMPKGDQDWQSYQWAANAMEMDLADVILNIGAPSPPSDPPSELPRASFNGIEFPVPNESETK